VFGYVCRHTLLRPRGPDDPSVTGWSRCARRAPQRTPHDGGGESRRDGNRRARHRRVDAGQRDAGGSGAALHARNRAPASRSRSTCWRTPSATSGAAAARRRRTFTGPWRRRWPPGASRPRSTSTRPRRDPAFVAECLAHGVKIALGTDSHDLAEVGEAEPAPRRAARRRRAGRGPAGHSLRPHGRGVLTAWRVPRGCDSQRQNVLRRDAGGLNEAPQFRQALLVFGGMGVRAEVKRQPACRPGSGRARGFSRANVQSGGR